MRWMGDDCIACRQLVAWRKLGWECSQETTQSTIATHLLMSHQDFTRRIANTICLRLHARNFCIPIKVPNASMPLMLCRSSSAAHAREVGLSSKAFTSSCWGAFTACTKTSLVHHLGLATGSRIRVCSASTMQDVFPDMFDRSDLLWPVRNEDMHT